MESVSKKGHSVGSIGKFLADKGLRVNLSGNPDTVVRRVSTLEDACEGDITFFSNNKYFKLISVTSKIPY